MKLFELMYNDIPHHKLTKIIKKRKKAVLGKNSGVEFGEEDPINFDQRDTQNSPTA